MGLLVWCVLQTVWYVLGAVVEERRDEVGWCMANTFAGRVLAELSGGVISNELNGSMPSFLVVSLVI